MFSFMLSLLVLTLMFSLIGGAAFIFRSTLLRGREGIMYPFWILLLIITVFPLRVDLTEFAEPFIVSRQAGDVWDSSAAESPYVTFGDLTPGSDIATPNKAPITSENPIVMKLRRMLVSSEKYADEVSAALFVFWLAGAMFGFVGVVLEYIHAERLMRANSSECTDERVCTLLREKCRRMKIHRTVRLRIFDVDSLSSPCVSGIFRPTLYIEPGCLSMSVDALECVLTHELTHIRRFDMLGKLFCFFATSVHWFNPTAYRVRRAFLEDCELSCDYSVVTEYGNCVSSLYMGTILDYAERYSEGCRLICREGYGGGLFVSPPSGVSFLKRRYANMKNFKRNRAVLVIAALFVTAAALANTLVLSSCSGITTRTLGSAIKLTPQMDIMVRAYYDLDADDYITPEMVDGITSLKIETRPLAEDKTVAVFTVNGDSRFTSPLPALAGKNYYENYLAYEIEKHSADDTDEMPLKHERFHAYYCLKSIDDPELTSEEKAEMLTMHPELEKYGSLYVFDEYTTEREYNYLCRILDESELLDPWIIDSGDFNASSFGYFTNLTEVEFVELTPVGYNFPKSVAVTFTNIES